MNTYRIRRKDKGEGQFIIRKKRFQQSLRNLFTVMLPSEIEARLELCKERVLANTRAFYEKPAERERLLLFCKEMKKLCDALYTIWVRKSESHPAEAEIDQFSMLVEYARLQPYPTAIIVSFFAQFSPAYARAELLDLLEASVDSTGPDAETMGELVFTYRWLSGMLKMAVEFFRRL